MGSQPLLYRPRKKTNGCFFQGLEVKPSISVEGPSGATLLSSLRPPKRCHKPEYSGHTIFTRKAFSASAKKPQCIRKHLLLAISCPLLSPHPNLWSRWPQAPLPTTSSGRGRAGVRHQSCHQVWRAGSPMSSPQCAAKGGTGARSRGCLHPEQ